MGRLFKLKICQALKREITPLECANAQKDLPKKFCESCDWFSEKLIELSNAKPRYISSKYTVYVSKKLKGIIAERSRELKLQPAAYIAKILAKELLNDEDE